MLKITDINIPDPVEHKFSIIPVLSEKIDRSVYDYKHLISKNKKFKIHTHLKVEKSDPFPSWVFLVAAGIKVEEADLWEQYSKSEFIVLFIVEEIATN